MRTWAPAVCKDHHTGEPTGVGVWGEEKQHDLAGQRKNSVADMRAEGAEWYKNPARFSGAEGKPSMTGFLYYEAAEAAWKALLP